MKKLLSALAAVVTLLAANSCLREPDYIQDPSQAVTVSYSVTLDQVQKTKATLADLDNTIAVNKLFYSVYVQSGTGTTATFAPVNHSDYHKVVDLDDNGTAEVKIKLIENDTYKVVFWAQKDNAYLAVPTNGNLTAGALENISIDYTDSGSYADDKDAFTAYDILEISPVSTDDANGKSFQKEIHLKRPFAQINFGADDGTQAAALGYTPSKVKVSVKQAATTFNAATGVAGGAQDVVLKQVDLPETAVNFTVNNTDYQRIGKAYVLPAGTFTVDQDSRAITDALTANVEITLDLQLKKADQTTVDLDARSKANVPVRSNYRTNLLGSLITTDVTFNVVVDNDYDCSTDYISIVTAGNASGNGAVSLTQPETISSNINFGEHPVTLEETLTIGADVTITGGASITVNKGIVVASGNTLTLDDVTINPSSSQATITIEPGATLIINGGTYTANSTQKLFDLLSGTTPNPAPGLRPRAHGADGDQLIIRGGSFTGFDPTPYVDTDHYTVTGTGTGTDPWTVAAKQVTLTVEAGDVNMKVGDEAVLKTLTVDPADTDLTGISFEYSVANVATASYNEGKISIAAVGAGSTVITVKVGTATATINVTVLPADSIEVAPASLSLKVGQTSEALTVTLNNDATVSSVVSNNTNATVNWTSGNNTFTVTGAAIGESTITVTASNGKTATVAVTVSKADAVKLATPVLSTENAVADATSIMLSWAAVEHATGYAVSYSAESPVNVTEHEVTLENLAPATEYTISVVAKGDGDAYTDSDASSSIKVTTEKGDVTIVVAKDKDVISIVKGLTATISGVSVKYGETVLDVPVSYALGTDAEGKITVSGTTITAVDVVDAAGINIVFAGNDTYNAKTESDAIKVEVTAPVVESITLDATAATKSFTVGDTFNHNNVKVTANYNNNTTVDVTAQATFSEPDMTSAGDKTVTVSFGGKDATYTIHVNNAVTLSSVAITTQASTTTFTEGDVFVATDLVLTGTYSDNSTKTLEPTFEIGGEVVTPGVSTLSGAGQKTVTVYSAEDATKTASYNINVEAAPAAAKTIAEIKALIPVSEATIEGSFTIDAVVTGVYGETTKQQNVFIEDSTGGILIYGCGLNVTAGNKIQGVISGLKGKQFNGLNEITAITIADGAIKDGGTVTETVVTLAQIAESMDTYVSRRVKVENVTFTQEMAKAKNSNVTIDGVKIYVSSELPSAVAANTVNDLVGYPCPYNSTKELTLWGEGAVTYKSTVLGPATISGVPSTLTLEAGATYDFASAASVTPSGASLNYAVTSGNGTITAAGVLTVNANASNGDEIVVTVSAPAVDNVCLAATPVTCTVTVGVEESLAGDYVIAAYVSNKYHAMTSTDCGASTKRFASEEITYSGSGSITVTNNDKLWSLEKVSGGYILKAAATNTYFGWDGSSKGAELKAQEDALVLTFTENTGSDAGTYAVVPVSNSAKNLAKNSSYAYFGIYNTGQANKIVLIPASFEAPTEFSITYAQNLEGGSVSGPATAYAGAEVTITATPAEGNKLKAWAVTDANNQTITVTNNKFTMPSANVNVTAEFEDAGGSTTTDYTTVYTSNVTVGSESISVGSDSFDCAKAGTSKAGGSVSVTVPSGTTKLHVHMAAYGTGIPTISVSTSVGTISPTSQDITGGGISGNSPYTLSGNGSYFYYEFTLSGVTSEATVTFTTPSGGNSRFVLWGVNAE